MPVGGGRRHGGPPGRGLRRGGGGSGPPGATVTIDMSNSCWERVLRKGVAENRRRPRMRRLGGTCVALVKIEGNGAAVPRKLAESRPPGTRPYAPAHQRQRPCCSRATGPRPHGMRGSGGHAPDQRRGGPGSRCSRARSTSNSWRWRESNPRPTVRNQGFSVCSPLRFSRPRRSRGQVSDGPSHCLVSLFTP